MNNPPNSESPPVIPNSPPGAPRPSDLPLGQHPDEQKPIGTVGSAFEAILREPRRVLYQLREGRTGALTVTLTVMSLLCIGVYGLVVGTFSGGRQLWAAPVKLAAGLVVSALICFPSLFIFACLSGSKARLGQIAGLLAAMVALSTVLLIGFAPVAWVFSQSTGSVAAMGALHLAFWGVASFFGFRFLHTGFRLMLNARGSLKVWTVIFVLVTLQMTTALRPIVGTADTLLPTQKKFFLTHWFKSLRPSGKSSRVD
jgi:hypothetical protein